MRHIIDPTNISLLDPDGNIITQDGISYNIDQSLITIWNEGKAIPQNLSDFHNLVFTESQIGNILEQIKNIQEYYPVSGIVNLSEGSEIGVRTTLKTSENNKLDLYVFIQQQNQAPIIQLQGYQYLTLANSNTGIYQDPGVVANDYLGNDISNDVQSNPEIVDLSVSQETTFQIDFNVSANNRDAIQVSRYVTVLAPE